MEDAVSFFKPLFPVRMWARHLNSEVQPEGDTNIYNNGGRYWILGYKTEGRATLANTVDSGSTEILGSLVYPASGFAAGNTLPAFIVKDACFSVTGLTRTSYAGNGWYGISVKETQGAITNNFLTSSAPNFFTMPFYSSSKNNCCLPLALWEGSVSNVWESEDNWSCGQLPNASTDVVIGAGKLNYPQVNVNTSVRTLTVNTGATITIKPGVIFTVIK